MEKPKCVNFVTFFQNFVTRFEGRYRIFVFVTIAYRKVRRSST
jgi:hypothetical protein